MSHRKNSVGRGCCFVCLCDCVIFSHKKTVTIIIIIIFVSIIIANIVVVVIVVEYWRYKLRLVKLVSLPIPSPTDLAPASPIELLLFFMEIATKKQLLYLEDDVDERGKTYKNREKLKR